MFPSARVPTLAESFGETPKWGIVRLNFQQGDLLGGTKGQIGSGSPNRQKSLWPAKISNMVDSQVKTKEQTRSGSPNQSVTAEKPVSPLKLPEYRDLRLRPKSRQGRVHRTNRQTAERI
uniref:Uncharacterized protein n=1 Tax=Solanum tuberosum TaxID=4113 RepID=M1DKZ0_SOLTU